MSIQTIKITYIDYYIPIPLKRGETRKITNRSCYGIVFSPDGICHYTQNGITHTNDNSHVLLLPKGGTYTIFCESDSVCPLINFDCEDVFPEILDFEVTDSVELIRDFEKISNAWAFNRNEIYYTAMKYLYEIFESVLQKSSFQKTEMPPLLLEARTFISQHYTDSDLEIGQIARHLNISEVYFRKLFKDHYGISPMKYINQMRIRQAQSILHDQMLSIGAVAELSGFSSIYSFSRTFKRMMGYPPSDYQKYHVKH